MRLVAWNANYNCMRRSLEENVRLLEPLNADVLVLSEAAPPHAENPFAAQWIGNRGPGLAVIPLTGLTLTSHAANAIVPTFMGAFTVSGRVAFDLLAVWPVRQAGGPTYHGILTAGLERYAGFLSSGRAIMAGDLNSSTRVLDQKKSHPLFVKRVEATGLMSAYHTITGEMHGEESVATFLHGSGINEVGFHIDYCFVAKALLSFIEMRVLNGDEWARRSDHFPIVLDVHDDALKPSNVDVIQN